jgi:pimeloyl-ACP methyl ester carboxylesterase
LPRAFEPDVACRLYDHALDQALITAQCFGRVDPRRHLLVNAPGGAVAVPVSHHGFVWSPQDFQELIEAKPPARGDRIKRRHCRPGLGAPVVVSRRNACQTVEDRFLKQRSYFAATAVLHPDVEGWLGNSARPPMDRLEFHDPYRVDCVGGPARSWPLAADFDAPIHTAEQQFNSGGAAVRWVGLLRPETNLSQSRLTFAEPYQPGKIPVVLIHGLVDDQFNFSDMAIELKLAPGFQERYQLAAFNYATGVPFLSSAAILRTQLRVASATLDPTGQDRGMNQTVLVGYSMGGLLSKTQISYSGDALRKLALRVPIEQLRADERTGQALRDRLEFGPVDTVRTVIYVATPHDGSSLANRGLGRITSLMIRRPTETRTMIDELDRNNPGAVTPLLRRLPTSVDLLLTDSPVTQTVERLQRAPGVVEHTILGAAHRGLRGPKGDYVVPIQSASIASARSETWVEATHLDIASNPSTIATVRSILGIP